jgi:hypothetical protein
MTQLKELMDAYQADELPKELVFPLVAKIKNEVRALKREFSLGPQARSSRASGHRRRHAGLARLRLDTSDHYDLIRDDRISE